MKVQVLSIEARGAFDIFDVEMLVGATIYTSQVRVDVFKLGGDSVQHASSERDLWEILQHNARAVGKIYKLVFKIYNGKEVELPVTISENLPINLTFARQPAFAD